MIALTGDYISWDPEAQGEVVRVLAGLKAPHGVFGCMGNHEADVGIEDSITRLFAAQVSACCARSAHLSAAVTKNLI